MLYTVSIPIADKRVFLCENTYRLDVKQFPRNWDDSSFLRSYGKYGYRTKPGRDIPFQEKTYAKANRGILISDNQHLLHYRRSKLLLSCVFRRVFFDDYSARIDVGIKDAREYSLDLELKDIVNNVQSILNCKVYTKHCSTESKRLVEIGRDLCYQFLYSTTKLPSINWHHVNENWFTSCCPAVVVECDYFDLRFGKLKETTNLCKIPDIPVEWGLDLFYFTRKDSIPFWIIVKGKNPQKDMLRALRIYLLKYHQERETLKAVMRLIAEKGQENILEPNILGHYINTITSTFSRIKRDGIEQKHIIDVVRSADHFICGDESQALLNYLSAHVDLKFLEKRCKTVVENHYDFTNAQIGNVITGGTFQEKVTAENQQTINIDSTIVSGVDQSQLNELLNKLDELVSTGSITNKHKVKKYTQKIKEEAEKESPDKGKLETFLDVLKAITVSAEFAKTVFAIAQLFGLE